MIECPKCGGMGGQDASEVMMGERGWLSCYFCAETGWVTPTQARDFMKAEQDALDAASHFQPQWDDLDDLAGQEDYRNEVTSTWCDSEPDYRWMDEEIPF